jgi:hypothetical protein
MNPRPFASLSRHGAWSAMQRKSIPLERRFLLVALGILGLLAHAPEAPDEDGSISAPIAERPALAARPVSSRLSAAPSPEPPPDERGAARPRDEIGGAPIRAMGGADAPAVSDALLDSLSRYEHHAFNFAAVAASLTVLGDARVVEAIPAALHRLHWSGLRGALLDGIRPNSLDGAERRRVEQLLRELGP